MDGWMEAVRRYASSRRGRAVRRDARCFPRAGNKAPPPPPRSAPPPPAARRRSAASRKARAGLPRPRRKRAAGAAPRGTPALRGGEEARRGEGAALPRGAEGARSPEAPQPFTPHWRSAPGRALPPTAPGGRSAALPAAAGGGGEPGPRRRLSASGPAGGGGRAALAAGALTLPVRPASRAPSPPGSMAEAPRSLEPPLGLEERGDVGDSSALFCSGGRV